ncbi:MAG: BON domain-containing protein [Proteobacteria bacterium]|nr:BON domain-containing protein [Desulfobacula sp.]MBU4132734.1 BON domain-containing protein [Pseudomonadota bacterium]
MKKQSLFYPIFDIFCIACIFFALMVVGCTAPNNASPVFSLSSDPNSPRSISTLMEDSILCARVKTKMISDDLVYARSINVDVHNGVAYLMGSVETDSQKRMAADLARGIEGIVRVENQLMVGKNAPQQFQSDSP